MCSSIVLAQEVATIDTVEKKLVTRPHIIYMEGMGRGGYYNIGYGYSFFQRDNHELNVLIGINPYWDGDGRAQMTAVPVGLFYRYGQQFKFELGFSITPFINWQRFRGRYYDLEVGIRSKVAEHQLILIPSLGFAYGTKNQVFEVGMRYTPYIVPLRLDNSIGYVFGAFFHYRLKGKK